MTFSILARDPETGETAAAAATGNLAVGAWVLFARAGSGVAASQGFTPSTLWGEEAMSLLAEGTGAGEIVKRIPQADRGADFRQLTVLDVEGQSAGWTGPCNTDCKGQIVAENLAIAGNWLANDDVLGAIHSAFSKAGGPLAVRMLDALDAGAAAGGDARGLKSAAIVAIKPETPLLDLRIDCSDRPLTDLRSLYRRTRDDGYRAFLSRVPTPEHPHKC